MHPSFHRPSLRHAETGAITIMVALMLLVLLTLVCVGMVRNSFKEILTSGTTRQAAMAENMADSGIEWSVYWLFPGNVPASSAASPSQMAGTNGLINLLLQNNNLQGQYLPLYGYGSAGSPTFYTGPGSQTLASDQTLPNAPTGVTEGFTTALMLMGHLPTTGSSQGVSSTSFRPAAGMVNENAPDLWAVRSDGQVTYNGVVFRQSREAWISTPTR